jgi:hypothetical protein
MDSTKLVGAEAPTRLIKENSEQIKESRVISKVADSQKEGSGSFN